MRRSRQSPERDLIPINRNTTHRREVSRYATNTSSPRPNLRTPPELQQEAGKEASRYIRHAGRSTPGAPPNPKDTIITETIKEYYAQIEQLADEKLVLAQRVIDLISRARARLDHDLSRVLLQQGEDPNAATISAASTASIPRRSTLHEIKETMRTPRETTPVISVVPVPTHVAGNRSEVFPRRFSYAHTDVTQKGEPLGGP